MIALVGSPDGGGDDGMLLTLSEVALLLDTSVRRVYRLVREGELQGCRVGARVQWRVSGAALRAYIDRNG